MRALRLCLIGSILGPATMCRSAPGAEKPNQYDRIVNDFIAYDIGQLRGQPGQQAYQRFFQALNGEEALPALVRGVNKAARIQSSCPIVVISTKLQAIVAAAKDEKALAPAFSELNAKDGQVYYAAYVNSLRQAIDKRLSQLTGEKPQLARSIRGGGTAGQLLRSLKPIEEWSLEDLQTAVVEEKQTDLLRVLEELKNRKGAQYTTALAEAIPKVSDEMRPIARGLLAQRLARMTDSTLRAKFRDEDAEVRAAAARAIGYKRSEMYAELAVAIRDKDAQVAEHAHAVLIKLTGQDFGPSKDASPVDRVLASQAWEKWSQEQAQRK